MYDAAAYAESVTRNQGPLEPVAAVRQTGKDLAYANPHPSDR